MPFGLRFPFRFQIPRSKHRHLATSASFRAVMSTPMGKPETETFKRTFGPVNLSALYSDSKNVDEANLMSLTRWTSQKSGLRVVHLDTPGPLCDLYATIATEITDDSGRPHTLEHLIFLGSESYPYLGVLDQLANRAFAQGTNAWTDTTNTAYTITTAGSEGFLNILPIFLDHIFYPTLKPSGFVTEVFHINGKAEDSGVVYSEMQGVENTSYMLMDTRKKRTLYPETSGFRSETGGLMDALRTLTNDSIQDYHGSRYLPYNTCVFVTGRIDAVKLLEKLENEVEPKFLQHNQTHGPRGPTAFKRPFIETPSADRGGAPLLSENKVETVEFPEADESVGEYCRSWAAGSFNDFITRESLDLLGKYLTDSAVSVFSKEMIEIPEPLSTDISIDVSEQLTNLVEISASDVPIEELKTFSEKVDAVLRKVVKEGIDMERMKMIIERDELKLLNALEDKPSDSLQDTLVNDFLFGDLEGKDLYSSLEDRKRYKELSAWSSKQWTDLIQKTLLDAPSLTVLGVPSKKLSDQLKSDANARIEGLKKQYGVEGLKKLQEKVDNAQQENKVPIPDAVISSFKIPSVDSINWIEVESARGEKRWSNGKAQENVDSDPADLPFFVQFDGNSPSNFVSITLHLFPGQLPSSQKELINLYRDSFFSLPLVQKDGTRLSFEDVIKSLDSDTVSYACGLGRGLSEGIEIMIRVAKDKYPQAISWLRDLLFNSEFDIERLRITSKKAIQGLPSQKRSGNTVAASAYNSLETDESKSISTTAQLLYRVEHEPKVAERLQSEPQAVVKDLKALRTALTDPKRMRVSVIGDIANLKSPKSSWLENFAPIKATSLDKLPLSRDTLSDLGRSPSKKALVYSVGSIESGFAYYGGKGPAKMDHPDRAVLKVVISAMNAMEGFLWTRVRGAGLAYGCDIGVDPEKGTLYLQLYRSPDAVAAWKAAKKIVEELADGAVPFDQLALEAAKSGLAYTTAASVSNMPRAAASSFANQALRGLPADYNRHLLVETQNITAEDCVACIKKWLLPLFQPETSMAAIATGKAKEEDIAKGLKAAGFDVEVRTLDTSDDDGSEEGSESGSDSGSDGSDESMGV